MTCKYYDTSSWLETVWELLHEAREDLIPEGDELYDERWSDVTTAMAWIEEGLEGATENDM